MVKEINTHTLTFVPTSSKRASAAVRAEALESSVGGGWLLLQQSRGELGKGSQKAGTAVIHRTKHTSEDSRGWRDFVG